MASGIWERSKGEPVVAGGRGLETPYFASLEKKNSDMKRYILELPQLHGGP